MSDRTEATDVRRSPGVRLLGSQLAAQPTLNLDRGARVVRVIGGRDAAPTGSAVRVVRRSVRSTGTRAGIRIIGRAEAPISRAGIRIVGGQDA